MSNIFHFDKNFKNHFWVWFSYSIYLIIFLSISNHIPINTIFVCRSIFFRIGEIGLFYVTVLWVFPKYLIGIKKIYVLIIVQSFVVLVYALYYYILYVYIFPLIHIESTVDIQNKNFTESVFRFIQLGNNVILFALGYHYAQKAIQSQKDLALRDAEIARQKIAIAQHEAEMAKKDLQIAVLAKEKAQAQTAFLRAQINPHFMYNTLNMIFERVRKTSREVGDIVLAFADMMRYATSAKSQEDLVPLYGELRFVEQYIELHLQRFQHKVYIDYHEEGDFNSHQIVPMVLITLVENGIKHGLFDNPDFPFKIRVSLIDDMFVFLTNNLKNPYPSSIPDTGQTGIGIENIKHRLKGTFSEDAYDFEIIETDDDYTVIFTINFKLLTK